jgi:hypothetical protein
MSSLTSESTLAEVNAAYVDNASYQEDNSTDKAAAFITACRILLLKIPAQAASGKNLIQMNTTLIERQMTAAQQWRQAALNSASGGGSDLHIVHGFPVLIDGATQATSRGRHEPGRVVR